MTTMYVTYHDGAVGILICLSEFSNIYLFSYQECNNEVEVGFIGYTI